MKNKPELEELEEDIDIQEEQDPYDYRDGYTYVSERKRTSPTLIFAIIFVIIILVLAYFYRAQLMDLLLKGIAWLKSLIRP